MARFAIETTMYGLAILAVHVSGQRTITLLLEVLFGEHYVVDWERVRWPARQ